MKMRLLVSISLCLSQSAFASMPDCATYQTIQNYTQQLSMMPKGPESKNSPIYGEVLKFYYEIDRQILKAIWLHDTGTLGDIGYSMKSCDPNNSSKSRVEQTTWSAMELQLTPAQAAQVKLKLEEAAKSVNPVVQLA